MTLCVLPGPSARVRTTACDPDAPLAYFPDSRMSSLTYIAAESIVISGLFYGLSLIRRHQLVRAWVRIGHYAEFPTAVGIERIAGELPALQGTAFAVAGSFAAALALDCLDDLLAVDHDPWMRENRWRIVTARCEQNGSR